MDEIAADRRGKLVLERDISPDLMYKDMLKAGLQLNDPALATAVAEGSNAAIEWAMKRVGAAFKEHIKYDGRPLRPARSADGKRAWFGNCWKAG